MVGVDLVSSFGLSETTLGRLRSVFTRHPKVLRVLVYGSRAKGNYRPGSDIDLSLDAPELSFAEFLKIEQEIDDLLLPYHVDLSRFVDIEVGPLREHIERVGRVL